MISLLGLQEVKEIVAHYLRAKPNSNGAVLATVVQVIGSAYRRPGARLLVDDTGIVQGSVSGGCLEKDVLLRARACLAKGSPITVRYDSTEDDNEAGGFRLGCEGVIDILIEPITETMSEEISFLARLTAERRRGVLSKVIRSSLPQVRLGAYFFQGELGDGRRLQDFPATDELICQAGVEALARQKSTFGTYTVGGATVEVFHEFLPPTPLLTLFGVGPDSIPLWRVAREVGFDVVVVDCRSTYLFPGRFQGLERWVSTTVERLKAEVPIEKNSAAVVMNHHYALDLAIVRELLLLDNPLQYLGCLGPKKRTQRILDELINEGVKLPSAFEPTLFAPVGLDIGALTPEEIALSIVSEICAARSGRSGGHLRDRTGPIHGNIQK